jgi:hypothetical protein
MLGGTSYVGEPQYHIQGPITYTRGHKTIFVRLLVIFGDIFINTNPTVVHL